MDWFESVAEHLISLQNLAQKAEVEPDYYYRYLSQ
jgi:hypothetical protein